MIFQYGNDKWYIIQKVWWFLIICSSLLWRECRYRVLNSVTGNYSNRLGVMLFVVPAITGDDNSNGAQLRRPWFSSSVLSTELFTLIIDLCPDLIIGLPHVHYGGVRHFLRNRGGRVRDPPLLQWYN